MYFYGGFTSSRGTDWNYSFDERGRVQQFHSTIIKTPGGWRQGPDVYARKITKECLDAIYARFEFARNPDHDGAIIITDFSQDTLVKSFKNNYTDTVTISKTPEGTIRLVFYHCSQDIVRIKTCSTIEEAEAYLADDFYTWKIEQ